MQTSRTDLHMHSFCSDDGKCSPRELVGKCLESGVKVMVIADHNSARADEQGKEAAGDAGITYISVVEIDCTYEGVNFHVLGYGIDYTSPDFAEIENNIFRQGAAASVKMLHAARALGFEVTGEEIATSARNNYWKDRWTGEMFVEIPPDKTEYKEHSMLMPYYQGGERGDDPYVDFYQDYYSQGKPCYVEMRYPGLGQTIRAIHGNGGYAVFIHPGVDLKGHEELLRPLIETGLGRIEVSNSYRSWEQILDFCNQARNHNLFYVCGSNYYGKTKPSTYAKQHGCVIPCEEVLRQLGGLYQYYK